eukprot:731328-Rhodomonas_salina.1
MDRGPDHWHPSCPLPSPSPPPARHAPHARSWGCVSVLWKRCARPRACVCVHGADVWRLWGVWSDLCVWGVWSAKLWGVCGVLCRGVWRGLSWRVACGLT